jgi:hypothetical protein
MKSAIKAGNVSAHKYPIAREERLQVRMLWPHLQTERKYTDFLQTKWVASIKKLDVKKMGENSFGRVGNNGTKICSRT